jgi:YHS domain-containing protein
MIVTPDSPHRIKHRGETHWFCTKRCLDKFRAWPKRYLGKSKHKGLVHRRFR